MERLLILAGCKANGLARSLSRPTCPQVFVVECPALIRDPPAIFRLLESMDVIHRYQFDWNFRLLQLVGEFLRLRQWHAVIMGAVKNKDRRIALCHMKHGRCVAPSRGVVSIASPSAS